MTWLFLFFLIYTTGDGARPRVMSYRAFSSEAACNAYGRTFERTKYDDRALRSFSICVPKSAYSARGMQTQELD